MAKIKKVYNIVIQHIPKEYHFPIIICGSTVSMIECLIVRDNLDYSIETLRNHYCSQTRNNQYSKILGERYRKTQRKKRRILVYGFSGIPILLNRYALSKETPHYVASVILHEIGHNIGHKTESAADKFAVQWMKTVHNHIPLRWENL